MFLDPNVGYTSEALGGLAARDWLHGIVPWWNPFTGIGMPLAGEMQPGAFFLPFSMLLAMPDGVLWLTLVMQAVAGLTSYALLREFSCSRRAALMGGLLFELNSTIAWAPGPVSVFCSLPFLPLLLWGIERAAREHGGPEARLAVAVSIAYMVLAGFPEPAYLNGLLAAAWWCWRVAAGPSRWRLLERVVSVGALGLCLAAPLLVAFGDDLAGSDAMVGHVTGWHFLPWRAFGMIVLPYVYGPLGFSVPTPSLGGIWGNVGGYSGMVLPLLALAGFSSRAPLALKLLLGGWVVVALAKGFGFMPVMWMINWLPGMLDVAFYRYFWPSTGFALVVLAAFGIDGLRGPTTRMWPIFAGAALLAASAAVSWPEPSFQRQPHEAWTAYGLWALSAGLTMAGLGLAALFWARWRGERRAAALAGLAVVEAFALFTMPILAGGRHGEVEMGAVRFLAAQPGIVRSYSLGPVQPNYGAYFKTAMIDHNVLPVPRPWAAYVDSHILPGVAQNSDGVIFWPAWPANSPNAGVDSVKAHLADLRELGVQFVLSAPMTSLDGLVRVYQDPAMNVWAVAGAAPYFTVLSGGPCQMAVRSRENVSVNCARPAVLLRRELYDDGWKVWIDEAPGLLVRQRPVFQAVNLPAGRHMVRFTFVPPYEETGGGMFILGITGVLLLGWRVLRRLPFQKAMSA